MDKQKRIKTNEQQKAFHRRRKLEAIDHYGGKCSCCGENQNEFLFIVSEVKRKRQTQIYNWLFKKNWPQGYQVICFNCNNARLIFKECPHEQIKVAEENVRSMVAQSEIMRIKKLYRVPGTA